MTAPENVYQVEFATTPERLWRALTDREETRRRGQWRRPPCSGDP
ncbi:MAG: hypothetical protein WD402_07055 [Chloroflexota bacterium]